MGYSLQTSASSSAAATGRSGDVSGGTAFNIGGINLGTQYPTSATAGGSPSSSLGDYTGALVAGGIGLLALVGLLIWKRKR